MSRECRHCGTKSPDEIQRCQWCGKDFDEPIENRTEQLPPQKETMPAAPPENIKPSLTAQNNGNQFDRNNKSVFYIFRFALLKSLSLKIWLGLLFWATILFLPVLKITIWCSKLTSPILFKLDNQGVDISLMRSTLKYLFSVQPEQISANVYLLYFIIWISAALIIAIFSGVCGYINRIITDNYFQPIKTFWQYLTKYYFKMLILVKIFILAGFFLPLAVIHLLRNSSIMTVILIVWGTFLAFSACFALPVFINNNYGIARTFTESKRFIKNNFLKAAFLFFVLAIFGAAFQTVLTSVFAFFNICFPDRSWPWILLSGIILFALTIYQMLVFAFSSFSFYTVHSQKETAPTSI